MIASQAPVGQQEALETYLRTRVREQDDDPDVTDGGIVPPPSATDVLGQALIAGMLAGRIEPSALAAIIARAQEQIHADTWPLAPDAEQAMKDALIEGVIVGDHPEHVARDMLARTETVFNGGLTRAMTLSRTEMLDAYRAGSAYVHRASADLVEGWQWYASTDRKACSACFARHGTIHPVSEPGPDDHPRGRCTRLPVLKPWSELGITAPDRHRSVSTNGPLPHDTSRPLQSSDRPGSRPDSGRIIWPTRHLAQ